MSISSKIALAMSADDASFEEVHDNLVKVADDFAIEFAEWCDDNYFRMGNTSFWAESMDWDNDNKFTTKELLEIYKKTL